jgi:hypothetical protein
VARLRDGQFCSLFFFLLGMPRFTTSPPYIKRGKLWDAFVADERRCC